MAEPLAVLGGLAAGLQLATMAGKSLLATIQLVKNLDGMPEKLARLMKDVEASTSRLCYNCNAGSIILRKLDASQMSRLSQCAADLGEALQEISSMLQPFTNSIEGRAKQARQLWKNIISLKIEKELTEKLQRLNRLNIELTREIGMASLEIHALTNDLLIANNESSQRGFTSMAVNMGLLQDEFHKFTLSVKQADHITINSTGPLVEEAKLEQLGTAQVMPSSTVDNVAIGNDNSSSTTADSTRISTWYQNKAALSPQRSEQLRRYLRGDSKIGIDAGLRVLSTGELSNANLDHILFGLRVFYTDGNFDTSPVIRRPEFWNNTDLAIYLMKVTEGAQRGASESQRRGFRILMESAADATSIIREGTTIILIELLSTLSPVNTTTCPYVRGGLISYLCELAREQLPPNHPIGLVLNRLKMDNGDNDVTLRALGFIVDRLRASLGPLHELSQLAPYRLCGILRRSGNYNEALRVASEGIRAIRGVLGPGSLQERRLSRQLEHVYMDQCDWVSALSICFEIVGQQQADAANPDPQFHDECAVMTMEDVAKICECAGNLEQAIAWLKQAAICSAIIWGQTEAAAHIRDKLRELLTQVGREQETEHWE